AAPPLCRPGVVHRDHAPKADDGSGRQPLRRHDGRRRGFADRVSPRPARDAGFSGRVGLFARFGLKSPSPAATRRREDMSRKGTVAAFVLGAALLTVAIPAAQATPTNVRLTNDNSAYVSDYTLATGQPYTDDVLTACSQSRGRQNEPSIAVDPRNTNVVVGSSNDYCPVFNADGSLLGLGDIWLGYYRSENSGTSFTSSLVPGYIGDTSPYAALARVRTADSGDPVLAWDNHGRLFAGSESSGDRAGSAKTFGDVWVGRYVNSGGGTINDGKQFAGSIDVGTGSSAPNILGKFNDKTAIEVDRTGGACDGNVYFAWA